ncbi:hypothetical protein FGG08_004519 [Glutinoglossum americanum]|uniref:Uncharacterized protein n=1 Tax=Glutinoglossum americanum TaxID=1670608 RepID=A0A9P8I7D9_9PEZI|nr:hypothetical protein FGG08_004519 [Glutinoglossum americanum]
MGGQNPIKVQLLFVPDCPLAKKVRSTLNDCLGKTDIRVIVEELVGDYNSPTLLVNGFDVTGQPPATEGQTSCRLDLPNEEQVLAAIRGLSILSYEDAGEADILAAAFKTLLHSGECVEVDFLSRELDRKMDDVMARMKALQRAGHLQLDGEGCIVAAGGLSLLPTKHEISIEGRTFWAWCAFDVLGIFGALQASGFARSVDPSTNDSLVLNFVRGVPQGMNLLIFMGDPCTGVTVCDDWCPKVNFFKSKSSAEAWIEVKGITGSLISLVNSAVYTALEVILDQKYPGHRISADTILHFGPPAGILLASETTTDFRFVGMLPGTILLASMSSKIECVRKRPWQRNDVTRKGLPCTAAFACTDYKVQGRTLERVALELRGTRTTNIDGQAVPSQCDPSSLYVQLSRRRR